MRTHNLLAGLLMMVVILSGCSSSESGPGKAIFTKINEINLSTIKGNWKKSSMQAKTLRHLYEKRKWKLQLLGDEGEYEGLDQELRKLNAAVNSKDKTQTKIELASVRSLFQNIYSL